MLTPEERAEFARIDSGVFISPVEGRVDIQRATISGQEAVKRASRLKLQQDRPDWAQGLLNHYKPMEPLIEVLEDGSVKITIGDCYGFVSSMHLVDTKVNQMLQYIQSSK